ncbi:MAG: U32 family peptidase [Clostridia bacterium]|nr:U32 family peptidase [Clostridia bacterium]
MIELLAPAGNIEKLKTAFHFGADACYFAGKKYGLRAFSDNFEEEELETYIKYAHSLNKKCYITVNIIAHNKDFEGLKEYLQYLEKIGADAIIVADIGIAYFAKQVVPNLPLHISTQANITNNYSAKFFEDFGADRLILARELSLEEIKSMRDALDKKIELESFVHGAMCISYSGRCLLSNYFTGRNSNGGACVQACRWEYAINEKNRNDGNYYPIEEDERGTYILNSKDLCMIEHLPKLMDAGVTSFKIEGRMKSPYYVATIVNAYRRVIDAHLSGKEIDKSILEEVTKASHRKYTTGFYKPNENNEEKECIESSMPVQNTTFMAVVIEESKGGMVKVEQRNKFVVGDELEVLSPDENFTKKFVIEKIVNANGEEMSEAKNVQEQLYINCPYDLKPLDILRK